MSLSPEDRERLRYAKSLLENPGLAIKIANLIGTPIEKLLELSSQVAMIVREATAKALERALDVALFTLEDRTQEAYPFWHKATVVLTGAGGGALGLGALPVELSLTTIVMLRSIADIARSEGERLGTADAKLACLEVFALGGGKAGDDAAESGYFAVRAVLGRAVSDAAAYLGEKKAAEKTAPVLVRLIAQVAERFGLVVSEKVAAQMVPVLGAAGGAVVNVLFIDHFQDMARGHFIVRSLERKYGAEVVKGEYDTL